ncbi:MAG: PD40 domain-containing protein [Anaerolineaceae bacterium]|nr:PD40 domain-containing protein [Anaerolineaceae bacterium]
MVTVKSGKLVVFVLIFVLLVGCSGGEPAATPDEQMTVDPSVNTLRTTTLIQNETTAETPDIEKATSTPEPISEPTPFLRIDSQINLLPAGFYLVFYDLEKNSLEALSFQIKLMTIATGNDIFEHSSNTIYSLVGEKLVNMHTRENFLVSAIEDEESCVINSISKSGHMLAAGCEHSDVKIFPIGREWQTISLEKNQSPLQVFPQLSPDDKQVAFCMNDPVQENASRLYRIDLKQCMSGEECELRVVSSSCDDPIFAWSPDAKIMAVAEQRQGIRLYDFEFGTKTALLAPEQTLIMDELSWSPDGDRIAYTRMEGTEKKPFSTIYLANIQGGEPRLFFQSEHPIKLVGWLNIITTFKPNGRYVVLPSENQFWLKDAPSHAAFNLKQFISGEKVRILDKSELVAGEKWWQVRVGEFTGWVVENSLHFQDDWAYGLGSPVFEPGRRLIVKISGNDLRLREMPSLNGAVKRYLQPGMKLKIVDGPAVVDKYNWWLVEIEESKIYGWVVEEALWYASD